MSIFSRIASAFSRSTSVAPQAFDGGKNGRRLAAIPNTTSAINDLIRRYGASAVARSRYLSTNNAYTKAARVAFKSAAVGYGILPSALGLTPEEKKAVQELWQDWILEADVDGQVDFNGMQDQVAGEVFDAGECFVVEVRTNRTRMSTGIPLQYRLLPAEMLPYWMTEHPTNGNRIDMGIEYDADGRRVAYHFLNEHPGDLTGMAFNLKGLTTRIPAERVHHIYEPLRVGAQRGVPWTLASLVDTAMVHLYDDAELERKRTTALFAAFVTKPADEPGDDAQDGTGPLGAGTTIGSKNIYSLQPGAVLEMLPGEQVSFATPSDVGSNYEAFQYRNVLRLAAGMEVPYAFMTGDVAKSNSGSFRIPYVQFKRRVTQWQWNTLIFKMVRPIRHRFLDQAALYGLLPWSQSVHVLEHAKRVRTKFIVPRWEWLDPLKDMQAEKIAVDNGYKDRWDTVEEFGFDGEETDERIAQSQKSLTDKGIVLLAAAAAMPPSDDPTNGPIEDEEQGTREAPAPKESADDE